MRNDISNAYQDTMGPAGSKSEYQSIRNPADSMTVMNSKSTKILFPDLPWCWYPACWYSDPLVCCGARQEKARKALRIAEREVREMNYVGNDPSPGSGWKGADAGRDPLRESGWNGALRAGIIVFHCRVISSIRRITSRAQFLSRNERTVQAAKARHGVR
jgi:hypothetical protein